jgi:hypothetical protein
MTRHTLGASSGRSNKDTNLLLRPLSALIGLDTGTGTGCSRVKRDVGR